MSSSIARGGTEAGSNGPKIHQVQQRQVPTVRVPHVLHKDKFVNQRIVTYRQVHTDLKPSRKQRKRHIFDQVERHGKLWK